MKLTLEEHDKIAYAFNNTFGVFLGYKSRNKLHELIHHEDKRKYKKMGRKLWDFFHERWPNYYGWEDNINRTLWNRLAMHLINHTTLSLGYDEILEGDK